MAKKKDFSKVNTNPVFDAIAAATAEPLPGQITIEGAGVEAEQEAERTTEPRKARKGYTQTEKAQFMDTLQTAGRKGCKLPRINLAFSPQVYDYVRTMARVQGVTITEFCNKIMQQHMEENRAIYEKAIEFRDSL